MEFDRLDIVQGLIQNTINAIEENEPIDCKNISDMAVIIKNNLTETIEYIKTSE